jgi:hypothetical protein
VGSSGNRAETPEETGVTPPFATEEQSTRTDLVPVGRAARLSEERPSHSSVFHAKGAAVDEVIAPRKRDPRCESDDSADGATPLALADRVRPKAAVAGEGRPSGVEWWNGKEWVPEE